MEKITFPLDSKTEKRVIELKEELYKDSTMNSMFSDLISRGLWEARQKSRVKDAKETVDSPANDNHTGGVLVNRRP